MAFCTNCGASIGDGIKFCPNCGSSTQQTPAKEPPIQQSAQPTVAPPEQQAYTPPAQPTYTPPAQPTYAPPAYTPPAQQAYTPPVQQPVQQAYIPPVQQPVQPPVQQSYNPPVQPVYAPPAQPTVQSAMGTARPPVQPPVQSAMGSARSPIQPPAQSAMGQGAIRPQPPVSPQNMQGQTPSYATTNAAVAKKKMNVALPLGIVGGVIVLIVAAVLLLSRPKDLPAVSYSYTTEETPEINLEVTDTVFPSLYRSLPSLVTVTATNGSGPRDVVVKAEVPGFTQVYEQKVTLSPQITKVVIHPPLLTGDINLNTEKDAQLVVSVTDAQSGKAFLQESKNIRIMSKYDVIWWTEKYQDANNDNILAWMTPESPEVLKLKRDACDYLEYVSDGDLSSIVGYQDYGYFQDVYDNTWVQVVAIQGAMSDIAKIRYNNASFSISSEAQQRVMLPDDVLKSQSGICIETALVMASALQSAGMHPMLIFPPNHAQVAVEAWPDSGDYYLIETTILPMPDNRNGFNAVAKYLTKEQWQGYIDGTGEYTLGECYVLDCDLGKKLGILPMSN